MPAKADPEKQVQYLKETLQPRLDEAKAGIRAVFFVDAAHFVLPGGLPEAILKYKLFLE